MKGKNKFLLILSVLLVGGLIGFSVYKYLDYKKVNKSTTDDNNLKEVAIFNGGAGEITYKTHIYKIDNGHENMGFKYKNETCTTKSYGSSEWNCNETKSGEFTWTDEAFTVAEKNNAYSYVEVPGETKIYNIQDFQNRFIMD